MQAIGFGLVYLAYGVWYTLYQKTWGDGSGLLYNLTGSSRFKSSSGGSSSSSSGGGGGTPTTGPGGAPTPVVPGTPVIVK